VDLKASVDLDDVSDRDSLHIPVTLTLLTRRLNVQMSCTSTYVALWSGGQLVRDIRYIYGVHVIVRDVNSTCVTFAIVNIGLVVHAECRW
jgi:hypothetical protein